MPQPPIDLATSPTWVFPLLTFCLGIFFATAVIRRGVEAYLPKFAARNQWKKVWLPSMPVLVGAGAAAIMKLYPFLHTLPTWGTRAFYGAVAGGLSSFMYKIFQAVIQARFGVKVSESSPPKEVDQDSIPTDRAPPSSLPKVRGTGYSDPDGTRESSTPPEEKP